MASERGDSFSGYFNAHYERTGTLIPSNVHDEIAETPALCPELHDHLLWDNEVAGREHRITQISRAIVKCRILTPVKRPDGGTDLINARVFGGNSPNQGGGFFPLPELETDPVRRDQFLAGLITRAGNLHREIHEYCRVFKVSNEELDEVLRSLETFIGNKAA